MPFLAHIEAFLSQIYSEVTGALFGAPTPAMARDHICGVYYFEPNPKFPNHYGYRRKYLPTVSQSVHARIVASTSRTTLTQTFVNPPDNEAIPELRYTFPLYDGVSVVAFTCTINNDRVIRGVVQEKNKARKTYDKAVAKGETAGLLEQLPDASDVFTTTIGNVPVGAEIKVEIAYLGELKHDAEVDGIRFTIPTTIAPRYGSYPGHLMDKPTNVSSKDGIQIIIDAEVPDGSVIKSIQSPSHPIAVSVGSTSTMAANATPSLQLASATLSLETAELDKDFIVHVIATNTSNPVAVLETHPTIPHQQAIMTTLVPKFKMASTKPEVVFVCDRSGSMGGKIEDLKNALQIFMKSLPVGCMFNICSFGSTHSFLFESSKTYDQDTLQTAMKHINTFSANFGGTEMHRPIEETFKRRHKDLDLEVFVLTDGEVWDQGTLFDMVNEHVDESNGAIRLFTLGVGRNVSHSLVEGLARAGKGFTQTVSEQEKMSGKVVRMLKGALTPHVKEYMWEVKYVDAESETEPEDDFEITEPESTESTVAEKESLQEPKKTISLFDPNADEDVEMADAKPEDDGTGTDRFSHVPTVKPPKVLQAPFQIPPLYPHSRTSVYLLLSPNRALRNKTPESVILRGTSSEGPLELQIPITVLTETGETVHQLAARKAVKELEEGRGWIFHAKDKDGQYLKKKHPGRFPAMVEREAVRLGVQFQVGGNWCSFVAVEENNKDTDDHEPRELVQVDAHSEETRSPRRPRKQLASKAARKSAPVAMALSARTGGPQTMGAFSATNALPPGATSQQRFAMASSGMGARSTRRSDVRCTGAGEPPIDQDWPPIVQACALAPPPVDEALLEQYRQEMDECANMPLPGESDDDLDDFIAPKETKRKARQAMGQALAYLDVEAEVEEEDEEHEATEDESEKTLEERFSILVSMQDFSGFWAWSARLLKLVGITEEHINTSLGKSRASQDILATAVAVAFLRLKLGAERDSWEMMEEKAVAWLEEKVGEEEANDLLVNAQMAF